MKKSLAVLMFSIFVCSVAAIGFAEDPTGEELFKKNCAPCHVNGGNVVNAAFTLHKKDREAHGVKTAKDIVGKMRNPGPGMTKFDKKTISDKDAMKIAQYVMKTFK